MAWFRFFQKKAATTDFSEIWRELIGQASAKSGIVINRQTVLQLATAQACARVITEDIAQLPFKLFQNRSDGGSNLWP